jgi:acetyl esterase/lipase
MRRALILVMLLGPVALARAEAPAKAHEVRTVRDIAYRELYEGEDADKGKNKLDLFVPKAITDFPVVMFVHGGAWVHGDKSFLGMYSALGQALAKGGIGAVITNYRLSPAVKHPDHIRDVARAFAWTQKHIREYGGRPDQIFLCGHSAGGHLVALLGTDESYLKAEGLSLRDVHGVIPVSGVFLIPERLPALSGIFGDDPSARRKASPQENVRGDVPPFLVIWADRDLRTCGKEPSEAFCRALKAKNARVDSLEIADRNHGSVIRRASTDNDPLLKALLDFVNRECRADS